MAKAPAKKPSAAKVLADQVEELESQIGILKAQNALQLRELQFYRGLERWTVYGTVTLPTGGRTAITTENLRSYDEARVKVVKEALRGKVVAAIVRLPFGASSQHREESRQVVERINGGKGWWE